MLVINGSRLAEEDAELLDELLAHLRRAGAGVGTPPNAQPASCVTSAS
jgi:hypothetical protein